MENIVLVGVFKNVVFQPDILLLLFYMYDQPNYYDKINKPTVGEIIILYWLNVI